MAPPESELRRNAILASLPEPELEQLRPWLEMVQPEVRHQIYEPGGPITTVHFPLGAVFSIVAEVDQRHSVEVATVGREGMVGLPVFLGAVSSPHTSFCQVPGASAALGADGLRRALGHDGALHQGLHRFTQATMVQIAQNVLCNTTHATEQRAARWLLTTHDRVGRDTFVLTQQFFAQMLGVRPPTMSQIAGRLQDRGLIHYRRGMLTVVDRAGLEQAACACYAVVRAEFDALAVDG